MTDGIINVNKPEGWTSQDVCSKLRHILKVKKIGHTGTLDPMATGVLPVCIGKATRIIEYYDRDSKSYHAKMKLGITTDTLDITGEVLKTADCSKVSETAVREAFKAYTGHVMQVPPKYSALKINGKRAYDLAREGRDFEIKPREIMIFSNSLTDIDLEHGIIGFDVTCSKGTYIRTICDDIGRELGCGAAMTALTRTASGYFRIGESHTIEEIAGAETPEDFLIPADLTLEKLGKIELNDNRITAFSNGNSSWANGFRVTESSEFDGLYRVYPKQPEADGGRTFLGIGVIENGSLVPVKVLR
jgi:tRNA pseudouridine55 synthase